MTFRSKYGFSAIFGIFIILACVMLIWFDRSRTQQIIEAEVQRAVEGELTRRQKLIDDAAQERYQAILQAVEKVETIARQVTPIPHSGPDILLRPPVENVDVLLRQLAYHFRVRMGTFITNEKVLICDDIGPGSMFLIHYKIAKNGVNNRTDVVVFSPKPPQAYPHNPPAVLSAKYTDPASSEQIENIIYETELIGGKYSLFATVQLYGTLTANESGNFSYIHLLTE